MATASAHAPQSARGLALDERVRNILAVEDAGGTHADDAMFSLLWPPSLITALANSLQQQVAAAKGARAAQPHALSPPALQLPAPRGA